MEQAINFPIYRSFERNKMNIENIILINFLQNHLDAFSGINIIK